MKKVIATAMIIAMVAGLAACGSGSSKPSSTPEPTPEAAQIPDNTSEPESTPESAVVPVVAGSNAYDITVSLEGNGLPEANRMDMGVDCYTFSATNAEYSYEIQTDKEYAVAYMQCFVFDKDNGFLGFCASFPRDDGKSAEAQEWVNANVGTEAETVIGDATYTLSVGTQGPILTVKAAGWDEYQDAALNAALGL